MLISLSSCLKTRAELRQDDDSTSATASAPVQNPVQAVQPQGGYAIDEIKEELTHVDGRLDDLEKAQKDAAATKPADDEIKKLTDRVAQLEQTQAQLIEAVKKAQSAPPADSTALFSKAKTEYQNENWDGVISPISDYLKTPQAKKADEAYFMRAEAYYHTEKYKLAIADYSEFPEKYTRSRHMAEALFKIGQSFEALGSPDDAKGFYQLLADKFPKSAYARKIKSKLR